VDLDGIDSDGGDSASCVGRSADSTSLYDPVERGVDNVSRVSAVDSGTAVQQRVAAGQFALALRLSRIDDYDNDEDVGVEVGTAHVPGCIAAMPESCRPLAEGTALVTGQMVVFEPRGVVAAMRLVDGRLRGSIGDVALPAVLIGLASPEFDVTIRDVRVDTMVSEDALDGVLGGSARISDVLDAAGSFPGIDERALRAGLESIADIDPSPSDPLVCASFSMGVTMSAIRVVPRD